jgi:outer membrane biosynthesis protein TonB
MTKYLLASLILVAACAHSQSRREPGAVPPTGAVEVTPQELEAQRIEGDLVLTPDADTKTAINARGNPRLELQARYCVDVDGRVASVQILKSSGFPRYDRRIPWLLSYWKFRPRMHDGAAVPACTTFTMFYEQRS